MEVISEREITESNSKILEEYSKENFNSGIDQVGKKSKFGQITASFNNDQSKIFTTENKVVPKTLETTETTFSKLEFDKYNLFFRTQPNIISFDSVKIKNTGTTCIYYKWQKNMKTYSLPEKKFDGIDRFFCHYSDSKLFPDEERDFVFSFFSEKNGVFAEEWTLVTSPPIRNFNSVVHLNGMCLHIQDKYSNVITRLDQHLVKKSNKTLVQEMLLDLISTIKEREPELPNMKDPNIFKFYFLLNNKEYK